MLAAVTTRWLCQGLWAVRFLLSLVPHLVNCNEVLDSLLVFIMRWTPVIQRRSSPFWKFKVSWITDLNIFDIHVIYYNSLQLLSWDWTWPFCDEPEPCQVALAGHSAFGGLLAVWCLRAHPPSIPPFLPPSLSPSFPPRPPLSVMPTYSGLFFALVHQSDLLYCASLHRGADTEQTSLLLVAYPEPLVFWHLLGFPSCVVDAVYGFLILLSSRSVSTRFKSQVTTVFVFF